MSFLDTFSEAGAKIMQAEHPYISDIYVDLEFLQDIRFGALLSHVKSEEDMSYVYSCVPAYNMRLNEKTCSYFPELKIEEKELDLLLSDAESYKKIACLAPMTSMYYNLTSIVSMILRSNKYSEITVPKVLQLWVSVDNKNYPQVLLDTFKSKMEEYYNKQIVVNTEITSRYTQSQGYYLGKSFLFLYDFESFVNKPQISMAFASEGKFIDHKIFAKPQINDKFSRFSRKELLDGVDKMRDQLNIYCDFEYCPSQIVIQKGGK